MAIQASITAKIKMNKSKTIVRNLKSKLNKTYMEMSEDTDIPMNTLINWANDLSSPSFNRLDELCKHYNENPYNLL